jgi:hypothetical protein
MCAYWALRTLAGGYGQAALGQALIEDARWGWVTMRARIVTRLHRYLTIARTRGEPDALTATLARLADHLARLWPDVGTIPLYPAFA